MHHSISFIMLTIIWFASNALADNARFNVQVLDIETAEPVKDAYVRGTFVRRYPRWANATEFSDFSNKTGVDGRLFLVERLIAVKQDLELTSLSFIMAHLDRCAI